MRRRTGELTGGGDEPFFRRLFEENPVAMLIRDAARDRWLEINRAAAGLYGYSREQFLGMRSRDLIPLEERAAWNEFFACRGSPEALRRRGRHLRKDGGTIEVEVVLREYPFQGRRAQLLVVSDVTERWRAMQALAASEQRYRYLFEFNPTPMWVRHRDTRRFLAVNDAAVKLYGYSREEFLSMATDELRAPEDREAYRRMVESRDEGADYMANRHRHRKKDGTYLEVEVNSRFVEFDGMPARLVMVNDVTERVRAEQALAESEQRYRYLFEANPAPMWVRDAATGGFLAVNDAAVALYGYSREEFSKMDGLGIRPETEHDAYREFMRTRDPRETTVRRWRHRRKDGTAIEVEVTSRGIAYEGRPARLALIKDVTEQVRAEQALRESEERFRAIFEQAAVGMALRGIDPRNPRWLRVNQRLADILGYTREELLELTSVDLTPPEDHDLAIEYNEQLLRGELTSYTREKRYVRKDGSIIWAEISLTAVRGPDGRPSHIISIVQDVTGRKRAEEALAREHNLLRSVIDALPDHVYVKDRNRRYVLMNASGLLARGLPGDEDLRGKTVFDILPPEVAALSDAEDRRVVETGEPIIEREQEIVLPGGEVRWYLTTKVPLRDAAGAIAGVIGVNHDVTEIRRSADTIRRLNAELEQRVVERTRQLEAANRELESFAYSVSHDLRAPLRSIAGFSQALLEDYRERLDETGLDYLRRVRNAAQRMAGLIEDLLALSRVSRAEMRSVPVDLSAMAAEIAEELRRLEPERSIAVTIAPGLQAQGDPSLLRVALQNLMHNAWKFTSRRRYASVEIGGITHRGRPAYYVRDNGAGFDMAYAGKLFGAFQRLHAESDFPGTGIGLATVQRVIHRHGGEVWAEAAVDRGATFFFTLGASPRQENRS
ncbi:MAG TPA: PAS domain S-box protein [Burkholderiales bacterium]|nr:PAS domain S-box protein [Burkholderiales bacterium]